MAAGKSRNKSRIPERGQIHPDLWLILHCARPQASMNKPALRNLHSAPNKHNTCWIFFKISFPKKNITECRD